MLTKFGAIITDGRGKVGSFYIGKNHYGTYLAQITVPANPQSTFQQLRRAQLAVLTAQWKMLTLTEQGDWIRETANYPRTNSIGNTYYLTGQTLFIGLNMNLWLIGSATITSPVTKVNPPDVGSFIINPNLSALSYKVGYSALPADGHTRCVIYATNGLSPGKNYISTLYRSITVVTCAGQAHDDIFAPYSIIFPTAALGNKTFCKCVTIDDACGNMGIPFFASEIIS